ncbi:transporter [uncultured Aliiroseovarius sp.]|uniref:transporter n=1 Tax=uncultured Aliiroseovarius sp. TaxID=1658783 RepID=UPI00260579C9|nr:transporter [uncultured Aliiroseovarius sp.]
MKKQTLTIAAALTVAATAAQAGIDRSGQDIGVLFEEGNYFQFGVANVSPDITSDSFGVTQSAVPFSTFSFGYKHQFNDNLSFALIWDQPYGADVQYIDGPAAGGYAFIDSQQLTGILRYEMGNGFSVHGGAFMQKISGEILTTSGLLIAETGNELGGVAGVAYEKPEIALRVALTYFTGVDHELSGIHATLGPAAATGTVSMPEAFNLDFQTGIAQNTLLFGSVRHAKYDGITLSTTSANGAVDWVDFVDDVTTYELGVGRKLNDNWSVALTLGYSGGADTGTTFLAPAGSATSVGLGASYTTGDIKISGGVRYTQFAEKSVGPVPFEGSALSAGLSVGIAF